MAPPSALCLLASLLAAQASAKYLLAKTFDASNFDSMFEFRTAADYPGTGDPTNGFVNYLSASRAKAQGLYQVMGGGSTRQQQQVFLGVDNASTISTSAQGRGSVRLESVDTFDRGLLVADIAHMPGNQCGVWPAFWTYNMEEDPIGEIDIIEGINHQPDNIISLHTCSACRFTGGTQTGTDLRSNCALGGNCQDNTRNDDGCGVTATEPASYGDAFNAAGGGVYAVLLTDDAVRIWHWPRGSVPADVAAGAPDVPTGSSRGGVGGASSWGTPMGDFERSNGGCDVGGTFHRQTIIINIDFCGDDEDDDSWRGDAACARYSSCKSFVAGHPEAFDETYWLFNSIKLYQE